MTHSTQEEEASETEAKETEEVLDKIEEEAGEQEEDLVVEDSKAEADSQDRDSQHPVQLAEEDRAHSLNKEPPRILPSMDSPEFAILAVLTVTSRLPVQRSWDGQLSTPECVKPNRCTRIKAMITMAMKDGKMNTAITLKIIIDKINLLNRPKKTLNKSFIRSTPTVRKRV